MAKKKKTHIRKCGGQVPTPAATASSSSAATAGAGRGSLAQPPAAPNPVAPQQGQAEATIVFGSLPSYGGGVGGSQYRASLSRTASGEGAACAQSSEVQRMPARPGYGTLGVTCMVSAYHYLLTPDLEKKQKQKLQRYQVDTSPGVSKGLNRVVMRQLENNMGEELRIHDGSRTNVDVAVTPVLQPPLATQYISSVLGVSESFRTLDEDQRREVNKALRGLKVKGIHRQQQRTYRFFRLTNESTDNLSFRCRGVDVSVYDYFNRAYKKKIQRLQLPCLDVGTMRKPVYLPMEFSAIVAEHSPSIKKLGLTEKMALMETTSGAPRERKKEIMAEKRYEHDACLKEFGPNWVSVEARRLLQPALDGDHGYGSKFAKAGTVSNWVCVNFARSLDGDRASSSSQVTRFHKELRKTCEDLGMTFSAEPLQDRDLEEADFTWLTHYCKGQKLDFILAILPEKVAWYADFKRLCETDEDMDIVSQCVRSETVTNFTPSCLANLARKINVKVGGTNRVLGGSTRETLPLVHNTMSIIFGTSVSHSRPGENGPSIAAVVASQDWPEMATYRGEVSKQPLGVEMIVDLEQMVHKLLLSFRSSNSNERPGRILFYRHGVSEGRFQAVLANEVTAIVAACRSMDTNYHPLVTVVVVQKRRHTRLFPQEADSGNRHGNVLAGTVVDTIICHPREFDFYLCSHGAVTGTSRPAHYHVIKNENNFSADELQGLTNSLCSTYARCQSPVSIVPPAYYAHHLAVRARLYGFQRDGELLKPKGRVSRNMFYC